MSSPIIDNLNQDIIRQFNIKCMIVVPKDTSSKPFVSLQVPKGSTIAQELDSLSEDIGMLVSSYLVHEFNMLGDLRDIVRVNKKRKTNTTDIVD